MINRGFFYIKTLGCKVNQYESQVIRERFVESGYKEAKDIEAADVLIVNTCTVTSTSDSKSLRLVHNALKRDNKCVIVTGCMVEDKDLDLSSLTGVKFIIKNKDKYRIPEIVSGLPTSSFQLLTPIITGFKGHTRAFVKVQDGCNNACSYCKVRVVRGRSRSRPFKEVLDECAFLVGKGFKEMVLTGICLGAYGRDASKASGLCGLISRICRIKGDWRLRLSSIEPKYIDEDLIHELKVEKRLCKHLHIPFQSGDNYILGKMQRPYKRGDYLKIVNRLKKAIQDIAISTDIMVGFPGETETRFQHTLDFIKRVQPMRIHIFPFSARHGTKAYTYIDDIGSVIKRQRKDRVLCLAQELTRGFINKFVNRDVELLVEDKRSREGYLQGYTDRYIKVYIDGPDSLKGRLVRCRPGSQYTDGDNKFTLMTLSQM